MRAYIQAGITLGLAAAWVIAAPALKPPPKKPLPLVGDWETVPDGPAGVAGTRLTITFTPDGKLKYDDGRSRPEWGWYKADPTTDPPVLDHATPGVVARMLEPHLGIYRLDGDTLTIYCTPGGGIRPTRFEAPRGSGLMKLTLRRVKKD